MANWCSARLVVIGSRWSVAAFAKKAVARPKSVFRDDMLIGEALELHVDRLERADAGRYRKVYSFQVRNDDGFEHFRRLAKDHRTLSFMLVYGDANLGRYGSYYLQRGRARRYQLTATRQAAVMRNHGVTGEEEAWRFWEASWELMDIAEAHWADVGARPNKNQASPRQVRPTSPYGQPQKPQRRTSKRNRQN